MSTSRHSHAAGDHPGDVVSAVGVRVVAWILAAAALATVIGLVVLWPMPVTPSQQLGPAVHGTVESSEKSCGGEGGSCLVSVVVRIADGPDAGGTTVLTFVPGPTDPRLSVGEDIRINRRGAGAQAVYGFSDIERSTPMLILAGLFVLVVLLVGRLRGLAAMAGLVVAGFALVVFVIPALINGQSGILVALVGGAAIALVVLPLSHGWSISTGAALLGTLVGMALAAGLAGLTINAMHFTGTSGDEAAALTYLGAQATVSGLLLAASVIGAIGVLNDVTVTQAVAVFEIAAADPTLSTGALFGSAMRIGRDHIASTVYSLVLAYAGSALPILLLFSLTDQPVGDVLTSDQLGPEVAAGLIGATALVLVVPLTTAIAALVARKGGR